MKPTLINAADRKLHVRAAVPADWPAIADLHLRSWRSAYQGILTTHYLDVEAPRDREALWRELLGSGLIGGTGTFVATCEEMVAGFVRIELDAERSAQWGPRIENLHADPRHKGQGIGRALLVRAAEWVDCQRPGSALHLYVFEKNTAARAFYRHMGGTEVERIMVHTPDGQYLPEYICWWESARQLSTQV